MTWGLTARIAEPEKEPLLGNSCVNKQQYQSHRKTSELATIVELLEAIRVRRWVSISSWRGPAANLQQYYWTEAVQVTNTDDRPDLSSEGAPYTDKTVNVKQ
jgi:hypothetical protein